MSAITDIAEAVKDELNGESFSLAFTAVRAYRPEYELPDMATLHVTVMPRGEGIAGVSRTADRHDYEIDIAVQKKFDTGDNAELDPLMGLVEEIADFLRARSPAGIPAAAWVGTANTPIYVDEHMDQMRQFTSVLTLTYRLLR